MKYRLEIHRYFSVIDTKEFNNIKDMKDYWNNKWSYSYDEGNISYIIYDENIELSSEEKAKLLEV